MGEKWEDDYVAANVIADEVKVGVGNKPRGIAGLDDPWIAERAAQRELAPMLACPNCGESRQDHLWQLLGEVRCDECGQRFKTDAHEIERVTIAGLRAGLDAQADIIAEQAARIDAQNAWNGNQTREIGRLAERVAALEKGLNHQGDIIRDIYRQMDRWRDKLDLARMNGDDKADQRIQARAIELEHRIDKLEATLRKVMNLNPPWQTTAPWMTETANRLGALERQGRAQRDGIQQLVEGNDVKARQIARLLAAVPSAAKPTIKQQCDAVTWRPPADSEVISGESAYAPLEEEDDSE